MHMIFVCAHIYCVWKICGWTFHVISISHLFAPYYLLYHMAVLVCVCIRPSLLILHNDAVIVVNMWAVHVWLYNVCTTVLCYCVYIY